MFMYYKYVCIRLHCMYYKSLIKPIVDMYFLNSYKLHYFSSAYNYFFYKFNTYSYFLKTCSYTKVLKIYSNKTNTNYIVVHSLYKNTSINNCSIHNQMQKPLSIQNDTLVFLNTYMFLYVFYKDQYLWNFISKFHNQGKKKKTLALLYNVLTLVKKLTGLSVYKVLKNFNLVYKKKVLRIKILV